MNRISFDLNRPSVCFRPPCPAHPGRFSVSVRRRLVWRGLALTGLFFSAMLFSAVAPVYANFYKYVDADGNIRFTDDLSQVPPEQRKAAPRYQESVSRPAPEAPASRSGVPEKEAEAAGTASGERVSPAELAERRKKLNQRKEALDKEYAAIRKDQKALTDYGLRQKNKYKAKEFLEKKAALEERVRKYEADRKAYEQAVAAYNRSVEEEMVRQEREREAEDRAASMKNLYKGVKKTD